MARVNVEETAWKKFYEIAEAMDWDLRIASGSVLSLWHESQERARMGGTGKEICRWSRVKKADEQERFVSSLVEVGLLEAKSNDPSWELAEYEIIGNDSEISRILSLKEKSKKGGERTKERWENEKKRIGEASRPTTSPPEVGHQAQQTEPAGLPELGTVQFSSVQCSSDQFSSEQTLASQESAAEPHLPEPGPEQQQGELLPGLPKKFKHKGQAVMAAYVVAWKAKYKTSPVLEQAEHGVLKRLKKSDIPGELLIQLVETYLAMNDSWFLTKRHDLVTFEKSLKAVKIKLDTGVAPTATEIRNADQMQATVNAFATVRAARAAKQAKENGHG